jgi:hypothetical protein
MCCYDVNVNLLSKVKAFYHKGNNILGEDNLQRVYEDRYDAGARNNRHENNLQRMEIFWYNNCKIESRQNHYKMVNLKTDRDNGVIVLHVRYA